jgi:hypothetical protein
MPSTSSPDQWGEYLLVAINKFMKWGEVDPVRALSAQAAIKFIRGPVCQFGVPNRIITDLSSEITSKALWEYCNELGTRLCYASVAHPRSNNQVERANAKVLRGLWTTTFNMIDGCGKN